MFLEREEIINFWQENTVVMLIVNVILKLNKESSFQ